MSGVFEEIRNSFPPGAMYRETPWNGAAFVYGLVALYRPLRVIEVGCCVGSTTAYIAKALIENGQGEVIAYENHQGYVEEATRRLTELWPGGRWSVVAGDFYETCTPDPVDFAFIDIDPKEDYVKAYERITWTDKAALVAHDATLDGAAAVVHSFRMRLAADGWIVSQFDPERGFLVGVR